MRILNVKEDAVTQGVLDKNIRVQPHLVEVTYEDDAGTPHTVFAHKDGPFKTPEDIVQAHRDRTLHDLPEQVEQPATPVPAAGPVIE